MIHEFAVDPELLVEWSKDRRDYRYFLGSFGLGEPRIVSRYPGPWRKMAQKHWDRFEGAAVTEEEKAKLELQRARFDELLKALSEVMVDRGRLRWDEGKGRTWLDNALAHAPGYFSAILARQAGGAPEYVLVEDAIFESPRWKLEKSKCVPRDADALVGAVASMLERCMDVRFIDPHFGPGKEGHMKTFAAFLRILKNRGETPPPRVIEVYATNKKESKWSYFEDGCKKKIVPHIPENWTVRILWLNENADEQLHNRYILTDLGGVVFGTGLDSGGEKQTDDLSLMSRAQYEKRWAQYTDSASAPKVPRERADDKERRGPSAGSSTAFHVIEGEELILKGKPKSPPPPPQQARSGRGHGTRR